MDIKALREDWKKRTIENLYPSEEVDWRKFKNRERRERDEEPAIDIEDRHWFTHCLLLATTGNGKTNAMRWRILQLLPLVAAGRASLIIMEPKGDLTNELLHLAALWALRDRLVILDPAKVLVSINLFDAGDGSPESINECITRFRRIFSFATADLSPFQRDAMTFAIRAMFTIHSMKPSLRLLIDILENGIEHLPVNNLTRATERFFKVRFKEGDGRKRAKEASSRLDSLLSDPIFETLFDADESTFNMLDEIQRGTLIVIKGSGANALFGNLWIEEVGRCIQPRLTTIPEEQRTPTFFLIDEAHRWIARDLHFAEILDTARGARIGMFIALQHLGEIRDDHVRQSLLTDVGVKFIAKSFAHIHDVCRSLGNCPTEFLTKMPEYHFGHITPSLNEAVCVKFPLEEFKTKPQLSEQQLADLYAANRRKYEYHRQPEPVTKLSVSAAPRAPVHPVPVGETEGGAGWS